MYLNYIDIGFIPPTQVLAIYKATQTVTTMQYSSRVIIDKIQNKKI